MCEKITAEQAGERLEQSRLKAEQIAAIIRRVVKCPKCMDTGETAWRWNMSADGFDTVAFCDQCELGKAKADLAASKLAYDLTGKALDESIKREDALKAEVAQLLGYITHALPFLEEAWEMCFRGQKERLLTAEERGMGQLLRQFRAIAAGEHPLPPGAVTAQEHDKRVEDAMKWAHRLLGSPNELLPELQRWMTVGETCADGLKKCNAEVKRLTDAVTHSEARREDVRRKLGKLMMENHWLKKEKPKE